MAAPTEGDHNCGAHETTALLGALVDHREASKPGEHEGGNVVIKMGSSDGLCTCYADGKAIGNLEDMKEAAIALHGLGPQWVLVKVRCSARGLL